MQWFDLVLLILAAYRLTHLLVFDTITEPLRRPLRPIPFLGELISCYWCAGVWVAALLVFLDLRWPGFSRPLLLLLAVAGGQAILETFVRKD